MSKKNEETLDRIRGLTGANRYRLTLHARDRMEERGLVEREVRNALITASACEQQGEESWKVFGVDGDGEQLVLIVVLHDDVLIVTMF